MNILIQLLQDLSANHNMTKFIKRDGVITITYTKKEGTDLVDEETLIFWLFKIARQFGLDAEIENQDGDMYTEDEVTKDIF